MADRRINRSIGVAVVGAAGTIGAAIVRELATNHDVVALRLIDIDAQRLAAVAARYGGPRATTHVVDLASPDALAPHLRGLDVVVNAAPYELNIGVMQACLTVRTHYVDLGGMHWVTRQQLELNNDFIRARRLAILGLGANPGVANLLAARAMRELADMGAGVGVESLEIFEAIRDPAAPDGGRLHPPYPLVDGLSMKPIVRRHGNDVELEPLADGGIVDFGNPIHEAATVYTLGACLTTFGRSFGAGDVSQRSAFVPSPSDTTVRVLVVRARATSGHNVTVRAQADPYGGFGGAISGVAAPVAVAVRMFARGEVVSVGALAPERCLDAADFFGHLEARGYTFQTRQGWRSPTAPKPAPREIIVP